MVGSWLLRHYRHLGFYHPEFLLCKRQVTFGVQMGGIPDHLYRRRHLHGAVNQHTVPRFTWLSTLCPHLALCPPHSVFTLILLKGFKTPACGLSWYLGAQGGHFIKLSLWAWEDVEFLAENEDPGAFLGVQGTECLDALQHTGSFLMAQDDSPAV